MDISKLKVPKKVACAKLTNAEKCNAAANGSQCLWDGAKCMQSQVSLFDEFVRIAHTKSGKYIIEVIAKNLHVNYIGRSIKSICHDIQELLHVAMHGNTIKTIAPKLNIDTKTLSDNEIYYKIYQHIFDKLSESNHPEKPKELEQRLQVLSTTHSFRHFIHAAPITPGYIDFTKDRVVYKNEYQFTKRVEYANEIHAIIAKYTKKDFCQFKKGFEKVKRIGSDSHYGEAYIGYNGDAKLPIYVAIKLMPLRSNNFNEVEKYTFFTNYVVNNISPHFPLIYKSLECGACQYDNKRHFKGPCITVFNELAQGDLKSYLKSAHSSYDLVCIFGQLIMTCLAMEHAGYVHNDMHWGNYLYHYVPEYTGKYMHYIYHDTRNQVHNVYLKNNGIVFIGWDFADMAEAHGLNANLNDDLYRILHIYKWAVQEGYPAFPGPAEKICIALKDGANTGRDGVEGLLKVYGRLLMAEKSSRLQSVVLIDPVPDAVPAAAKIINSVAYELAF
jgi:hypothetical protein